MRAPVAAAVLAVLVVTAGCSDIAGTGAKTPTPENPWRNAELTVTLDVQAGEEARYEALVEEALRFWTLRSGKHTYPVTFSFAPNETEGDVEVRIVDEIYGCDREAHSAGCSFQINKPQDAPETVPVKIQHGFDNRTTLQVLKHELGHVIGLAHGDSPRQIMASHVEPAPLERPNATERERPWNRTALRVAVTGLDGASQSSVRDRQIDAALRYYAEGAAGTVPENLSFTRVSDPSAAEIRIELADGEACGGAPTCGEANGEDVDEDGASEYYTGLQITLADVPPAETAWYVARGLARGFGDQTAAARPPPLQPDAAVDPASEWWE